MSTYSILTPNDNTDIGYNINQTYEKGHSEYNRLYIPNEGIDDKNNLIHYFSYGYIAVEDKIAIDQEHIFLKNGYLVKPGLVVEKYFISKEQDGIILGDEKYFRVVLSNVDEIKPNSIIIVMSDQGHRFNINKEEYFFVQPDKVLIVINELGIKPGPHNMLLKHVEPEILGMGIKNLNKGTHAGITYYCADALYDVTIKHIKYMVVAKKDIKLYE